MPNYSLHLEAPGEEPIYVASQQFDTEVQKDEKFTHEGRTWKVVEVAVKQFDAPGEPELTIRAVPHSFG